jgi:hypothetical protein
MPSQTSAESVTRMCSQATPQVWAPNICSFATSLMSAHAEYVVKHLGYTEENAATEMLRLYKEHGTTLAGLVVRVVGFCD